MTDSLARLIFDGVDAGTQMKNFFYKIERPTLENVKFDYIGNVKADSLSNLHQGQMYKGGQTAVVGETKNDQDPIIVTTKANSRDGAVTTQTEYSLDPSTTDQMNCKFMKRFFAYLQIKQDLENAEKLRSFGDDREDGPLLNKAKEAALEFNFVTYQTS